MSQEKPDIRPMVRKGYAEVARGKGTCCGPSVPCCSTTGEGVGCRSGYSKEELSAVPEGANLGLGCGNPVALAGLRPGETVLDLGSGPGLDCFLAAQRVGPSGRVIGVDMTPEMVEKARENARKGNYPNVEFRLGEIEHLPVADNSVDVVISNCVINLSPDKGQVFREAFRVLRPGGRLLVSDIVLTAEPPPAVRASVAGYVGCISGAALKPDYLNAIAAAGFSAVRVVGEDQFPLDLAADDPTVQQLSRATGIPVGELAQLAGSVLSVKVAARKPD